MSNKKEELKQQIQTALETIKPSLEDLYKQIVEANHHQDYILDSQASDAYEINNTCDEMQNLFRRIKWVMEDAGWQQSSWCMD